MTNFNIKRRTLLKGAGGAGLALMAPAIVRAQDAKQINIMLITNPFSFTIRDKLAPEFESKTGVRVNVEILDYTTLHQKAVLDAQCHEARSLAQRSRTFCTDLMGRCGDYMG